MVIRIFTADLRSPTVVKRIYTAALKTPTVVKRIYTAALRRPIAVLKDTYCSSTNSYCDYKKAYGGYKKRKKKSTGAPSRLTAIIRRSTVARRKPSWL